MHQFCFTLSVDEALPCIVNPAAKERTLMLKSTGAQLLHMIPLVLRDDALIKTLDK